MADLILSGELLKKASHSGIKNHIDDEEQYKVIFCDPWDLILPSRIDILAKVEFAKSDLNNIQSNFFENLYVEHIRAFNNFFENDESKKIGKDSFLQSFRELISKIQLSGFDVNHSVPLSKDGVVLDGAHRVAAAAAIGIKIPVYHVDIPNPNYGLEFFTSRGLPSQYADYLALKYAERDKSVRMVVLWPSAAGSESKVAEEISRNGVVVYKKTANFTHSGALSLVRLAYKSEPWLGDKSDSYAGARNKASWCFDGDGPVRFFLIKTQQDLIVLKDRIRDIYKISKNSVHINDTHDETIELAEAVFNDNSLQFLNYRDLDPAPWFYRLFTDFKNWIEKNDYDPQLFYIDGSSTLGAYGLRDVRDLDYVFAGDKFPVYLGSEIDCHNAELKHHGADRDCLVFDPNNYFYFEGFKFISPSRLIALKTSRGEFKDKNDLVLMKSAICGKRRLPILTRIKTCVHPKYIKGQLKIFAVRVRYYIYKFSGLS